MKRRLYLWLARFVCRQSGHRYDFRLRPFGLPPPPPWEPIATCFCSRCGEVLDTIYVTTPTS